MRMVHWLSVLGLLGCGGSGGEGSEGLFRIEQVQIAESVVHQVELTGEIVLLDDAGFGGTSAIATFYRDEYQTKVAEANGKIGLELEAAGDRAPFELGSIQARLVPHEDGFDRLCVDLQVDDSNYGTPVQVGCLDGTPDPTTPGTTTPPPPPEEPPTAEMTSPFDLELFGLGETVDLDGRCTDPNQDDGTLQVEWTYEPADGTGGPTPIPVDPIAGDGRSTGSWYAPPLGDWFVRITCTDDPGTQDSVQRQISVVDRQLADLDGDGYTPQGGDCNDGDAAIHPAAAEVCDQVDNDCSGLVDDKDDDADGYVDEACVDFNPPTTGTGLAPGDCDDSAPDVYPGAVEIPYDGIDQDCDGYP